SGCLSNPCFGGATCIDLPFNDMSGSGADSGSGTMSGDGSMSGSGDSSGKDSSGSSSGSGFSGWGSNDGIYGYSETDNAYSGSPSGLGSGGYVEIGMGSGDETATSRKRSFECKCPSGYSGPLCDKRNPPKTGCLSNPCFGGSTCIDLDQGISGSGSSSSSGNGFASGSDSSNLEGESGSGSGFRASGWGSEGGIYGFGLEEDDLPSAGSGSGGESWSSGDDVSGSGMASGEGSGLEPAFMCKCPPGFTGDLCENNVEPCKDNPCVHGICVPVNKSSPGYGESSGSGSGSGLGSGDLENVTYEEYGPDDLVTRKTENGFVDPLSRSNNKNGGHKESRKRAFVCVCDDGFKGLKCDKEDNWKSGSGSGSGSISGSGSGSGDVSGSGESEASGSGGFSGSGESGSGVTVVVASGSGDLSGSGESGSGESGSGVNVVDVSGSGDLSGSGESACLSNPCFGDATCIDI
ncbi:unnamed protein product, partial [Owenia fusiformis]